MSGPPPAPKGSIRRTRSAPGCGYAGAGVSEHTAARSGVAHRRDYRRAQRPEHVHTRGAAQRVSLARARPGGHALPQRSQAALPRATGGRRERRRDSRRTGNRRSPQARPITSAAASSRRSGSRRSAGRRFWASSRAASLGETAGSPWRGRTLRRARRSAALVSRARTSNPRTCGDQRRRCSYSARGMRGVSMGQAAACAWRCGRSDRPTTSCLDLRFPIGERVTPPAVFRSASAKPAHATTVRRQLVDGPPTRAQACHMMGWQVIVSGASRWARRVAA